MLKKLFIFIVAVIVVITVLRIQGNKNSFIRSDADTLNSALNVLDTFQRSNPDTPPNPEITDDELYSELFTSVAPGDHTRVMENWPDRPYLMHVPDTKSNLQFPVILVLHGDDNNAEVTSALTCPDADTEDPGCMNALADRSGFIVVYPNGTSNKLLKNVRTFNAGGGSDGYTCVSGHACNTNVDDIAYFNDLLDDLTTLDRVDTKRIYATGISNGAAMTHRLACQIADRIAAVAPIAGANQFSATASCSSTRAVPVLQIHGTSDVGWPYEGGEGRNSNGSLSYPVMKSVEEWASRNHCNAIPEITEQETLVNDGTTLLHFNYSRCQGNSAVEHYRINNGGHTWPGGFQYLDEDRIGKTSHNLNANQTIWDFFKRFSLDQG